MRISPWVFPWEKQHEFWANFMLRVPLYLELSRRHDKLFWYEPENFSGGSLNLRSDQWCLFSMSPFFIVISLVLQNICLSSGLRLVLTRWFLREVEEILQVSFSNSFDRLILWVFSMKLVWGEWAPPNPTDDKSTLAQVMAWCHQVTNHYLSQCWPTSISSYEALGHNELIWQTAHIQPSYSWSVIISFRGLH